MNQNIHPHAGSPAPTPQRPTSMDGYTATPARSPRDILRDIQNEVADLRRAETTPPRALNIAANASNFSSSRNGILTARASPVQQHDPSATLPPQTGPPPNASGLLHPRTPRTRDVLHDALRPSSSSNTRILAHSDTQPQNAQFPPQLAPENRHLDATFQGASANGTIGDTIDGGNQLDTRR